MVDYGVIQVCYEVCWIMVTFWCVINIVDYGVILVCVISMVDYGVILVCVMKYGELLCHSGVCHEVWWMMVSFWSVS
jgi:hypothetical protein